MSNWTPYGKDMEHLDLDTENGDPRWEALTLGILCASALGDIEMNPYTRGVDYPLASWWKKGFELAGVWSA